MLPDTLPCCLEPPKKPIEGSPEKATLRRRGPGPDVTLTVTLTLPYPGAGGLPSDYLGRSFGGASIGKNADDSFERDPKVRDRLRV